MPATSNDTQACLPRQSSSEGMNSRAPTVTPPPQPRRRRRAGCIVWPLVPLRAALFCFFGGLGCLLVFLPLHMREVGLSSNHARLVSVVAPFVSVLGPLIVGPSADRLGKHKQVLLTACLLLGAATYCLLLAVPVTSPEAPVHHQASLLRRAPSVRLRCDAQGASIIQERCAPVCPSWKEQTWEVEIRQCMLDCNDPRGRVDVTSSTTAEPKVTTQAPEILQPGLEPEIDYDHDQTNEPQDPEADSQVLESTTENPAIHIMDGKRQPYLCFSNDTGGGGTGSRLCHMYNDYSEPLLVNVSLPEVASLETECHYPLNRVRLQLGGREFSSLACRDNCTVYCTLGGKLWSDKASDGPQLCPAAAAQTSDPRVTFWSYLLARSVADIFPAAALPLADTLVVVLARDHHSDVGRELAWGAMGAGLLVPAVCALVMADITPWPETPSALPILAFAFLSLLAAAALSGVRLQSAWYSRRLEIGGRPGPRVSHTGEAVALLAVLAVLGFFWGALDSYLPWILWDASSGSVMFLAVTVSLGTLLAVPLLWHSERIIDYCGHTNLFIVAFAFYIIRFTGYGFLNETWLGVAFEAFEVFTLCLMWVSAVVYSRQLVAKHLTATGQAMLVLAHFCLGRFLGALLGGVTMAAAGPWALYQGCALAAALLGWLYFSLYHCCVRPRCGARKHAGTPGTADAATDGVTSNGSYTPLRVYNGEQKQREMRY
ncbi:hypothetical protein B566_EDAN015401 [Ephemera danica]|nr:hypothetical protein B566_EDAN015401 [Ephemera danica]